MKNFKNSENQKFSEMKSNQHTKKSKQSNSFRSDNPTPRNSNNSKEYNVRFLDKDTKFKSRKYKSDNEKSFSQKSRQSNKLRGNKISQQKEKDLLSNEPIRLNKVLAEAGVASRRKADELIAQGAVKVNGQVVTTLGYKVQPDDFITVNGNPIPKVERKIYFLLNKPKDVIVSTEDEKDRKTVLDLVKTNYRIFPVGRLDRNTTGALILTNDGELTHRLLHPSYQVPRTYVALLDRELNPQDAEKISQGVELEDGPTAPCEVVIHPQNRRKVIITLFEGRNHEVKRIFSHFKYKVKQLDRKVFAGISIQKLPRGEYRLLSKKEILHLKKLVKII